MLRLRQMKYSDAKYLEEWLKDKSAYQWWGGHLIGEYPLTAELIANTYFHKNGLCKEEDNFYPWICMDDDTVIGSFIMRYIESSNIIRFGWVVVDTSIRGKGYGKGMLELGLKYAFEIYNAKRVTIGVYENNPRAYKCYTSIGFKEAIAQPGNTVDVDGIPVKVIELEIER